MSKIKVRNEFGGGQVMHNILNDVGKISEIKQDVKQLYKVCLSGDETPVLILMRKIGSIKEDECIRVNDVLYIALKKAGPKDMKRSMNKFMQRASEIKNVAIKDDKSPLNLEVTSHDYFVAYNTALKISTMLDIQCPLIYYYKDDYFYNDEKAKAYTALSENDTPLGTALLLKKFRYKSDYDARIAHTVAHEMRHIWQETRAGDIYYKDYFSFNNQNQVAHAFQPEEIDAEAFASIYVEKYHSVPNGIKFCYGEDYQANNLLVDPDLMYIEIEKRKAEIQEEL